MSKTFQHHFLEIGFKCKQKTVLFSVAEAAWGRFQRALQEERNGFFICATITGATLAINLDHIQFAKLLSKQRTEAPKVQEKRSCMVHLHFLDRLCETISAQDPLQWAHIFTALKTGKENKTHSFTNPEGNKTIFFTKDLSLLEISTIFLEDGFIEIYRDKTGQNPPA